MFGFGRKQAEIEFDCGYEAAGEFLDLLGDHDLTDEEANAQWDVVEANHSQEYVYGYAKRFDDESDPWWKFW